jgi:hypothetical protein
MAARGGAMAAAGASRHGSTAAVDRARPTIALRPAFCRLASSSHFD